MPGLPTCHPERPPRRQGFALFAPHEEVGSWCYREEDRYAKKDDPRWQDRVFKLRDAVSVPRQRFVEEFSSIYNVVGSVKAFLATLPPPRAGRGVKGERSEFIEDP